MRRPIIPAAGAAMLGAALLSAAAVDFEIPAAEPAEASLTPTQIAGEGFHIQNPVHSDGLMHHYVVESRFGLFTAYGRDALAVQIGRASCRGGVWVAEGGGERQSEDRV